MKIQKGFIQIPILIPILIAIIMGVLVIGGGSYFGIKQYQNYQAKKTEKAEQTQKIAETQLEALKREVEDLKNKTSTSTSKNNQNQAEKPEPSQTTVALQNDTKVQIAQPTASTPTLKPVPTPTPTPTPTPKVKTFTTPSGAVIDEAGNIILPPNNSANQISATPSLSAGSRIFNGEEIYSLVSPSVVLIVTSGGHGSGFVINNGKYTLTNAHVVGNDQTVQLKLQNGTSFNGVVLGKNNLIDLAVIFNGDQRPTAVTLGSSGDSLKIGGDVYAFGFPKSLIITVTLTKGTLSAKQNVEGYSGTLLQTDASINPGNSGGPLVNNKGEVIGVNAYGLNDAQGIYFAIPIQTAIDFVPTLSQYGQSRYEVYPIGSTMSIKKSVLIRAGLNTDLSCEILGFTDTDLISCNFYRKYNKDYSWNIIEDVPQ